MKQLWQDFKPVIILAAIAIPLCLAALIWLAVDKPAAPIRLTLPDPGEVTVCYYIPDVAAPYEQTWLGGEALETALSELAALEFVSADEPDGGKMVSCLVIATNERQIVINIDDRGIGWVYDQERGWIREQQ